jgi:hypothetical protein
MVSHKYINVADTVQTAHINIWLKEWEHCHEMIKLHYRENTASMRTLTLSATDKLHYTVNMTSMSDVSHIFEACSLQRTFKASVCAFQGQTANAKQRFKGKDKAC